MESTHALDALIDRLHQHQRAAVRRHRHGGVPNWFDGGDNRREGSDLELFELGQGVIWRAAVLAVQPRAHNYR
ncbi:MAG: hypothetical protein ACRDJH_23800 [Thermomicrobiales bacterium]